MGPHTMVGGCLPAAQGRGAQLFEGIRRALLRCAQLIRGVGTPERVERNPRLFGGCAVQQAGEGEPAVLGVGSSEGPVEVLACLLLGQGFRPLPREEAPRGPPESERIQTSSELQELALDRCPARLRQPGEHLGDALRMPRANLAVGYRSCGRFIVLDRPTGLDLLLDLRGRELLLRGEAPPVLPDRGVRWAAPGLRDGTRLRHCRGPSTDALELPQRPTQPGQESLDLPVSELIDAETGKPVRCGLQRGDQLDRQHTLLGLVTARGPARSATRLIPFRPRPSRSGCLSRYRRQIRRRSNRDLSCCSPIVATSRGLRRAANRVGTALLRSDGAQKDPPSVGGPIAGSVAAAHHHGVPTSSWTRTADRA